MLVGLLLLRVHGTMFAFGQFLWKQGLIWLFLATVSGVPPAVFICLNLNDPFNLMFQTPVLIVMTIGATRMHRSLADFADPDPEAFDVCPTRRGRRANTDPKRIFAVAIPPKQLEVALHESSESEDYQPANMRQNSADSLSHVLNMGNDLENGVKRG
ncbi:hypothetical protein EI94DRAFT_997400 [Lactarius quietus]|nr:hypothetical protein EI94DRAFT_997400 [Lactarius quietus]